jgi:multidrug efflux pump subunit AcrA (membrane-fusion protein)
MDREIFIEKAMRGEQISVGDVAQNQAERELKSIETEAAQRLDDERRRQEAAERREQQIVELMRLAEEATTTHADSEENERRKNEVLRQFAGRELELRGKYYQIYSQFSTLFHELGGEAYDRRLVSNPALRELMERGADLSKVDFELVKIPASPMAQMLSDERRR